MISNNSREAVFLMTQQLILVLFMPNDQFM